VALAAAVKEVADNLKVERETALEVMEDVVVSVCESEVTVSETEKTVVHGAEFDAAVADGVEPEASIIEPVVLEEEQINAAVAPEDVDSSEPAAIDDIKTNFNALNHKPVSGKGKKNKSKK
jgi:hypothetical protein